MPASSAGREKEKPGPSKRTLPPSPAAAGEQDGAGADVGVGTGVGAGAGVGVGTGVSDGVSATIGVSAAVGAGPSPAPGAPQAERRTANDINRKIRFLMISLLLDPDDLPHSAAGAGDGRYF